jgi:GH24 family phage-related lysozyme (muramidase)
MRISSIGLNLIKAFEGVRLSAYRCPANKLTIGYGHTGLVNGEKIHIGMTITQQEADILLLQDVAKFEALVMKYNKRYKWSQNEFDALVSFAFNIGSIHQLTAFGTRSKEVIAEKMLLYNKCNGKVSSGLSRRRELERLRYINHKEEKEQ